MIMTKQPADMAWMQLLALPFLSWNYGHIWVYIILRHIVPAAARCQPHVVGYFLSVLGVSKHL